MPKTESAVRVLSRRLFWINLLGNFISQLFLEKGIENYYLKEMENYPNRKWILKR
jgi:hypothetical protein